MNFKQAMWKLMEEKKITRPSWQKDSYWYINEVSKVILWTDGTPAQIHLNQLQANDWEVYEEPKVIILDDNELSIMKYAQEYPENWQRICKGLEEEQKRVKDEELAYKKQEAK